MPRVCVLRCLMRDFWMLFLWLFGFVWGWLSFLLLVCEGLEKLSWAVGLILYVGVLSLEFGGLSLYFW